MELGTADHSMSDQDTKQEMKTQPQHTRPRPGRRRQFSSSLPFSSTYIYIFTAMIVSLFCIPASAHEQHGHYQASKDHLVSRRADILFDAGPRPIPALYRRAAASSPSDIAAPSATAKAAATSIISQSTSTDTALPVPFDGGLGANFTQPSCPTFIRAMVNNSTFTSCLPFSLLLQNSVSFFSATRTIPTITHVLNASCSVVYPDCSNLISSYALTLRSSSACSQDYDRQNPIVRQAYAGLISYDILYQASCIKNVPVANTPISDDNNYCYANAVTNTSSPSDNYVYYLPLGIPLPAAALPTCDGCLKNTMAVFAAAAANKSQPLSLDYVDAATMINQDCGPDFVNGTIPSIGSSGTGTGQTSAAIVSASVGSWMIALGMVIAVQLFVS